MKQTIILILIILAAVTLVAGGIVVSSKRRIVPPPAPTAEQGETADEETLLLNLPEENLEEDPSEDAAIDEEVNAPLPDSEAEEDAAASALAPEESAAAPGETPQAKSFTIEADDSGFYPSGTITVTKATQVSITFQVRSTGVYFNGLDIKSQYFDTGTVRPGASKIVTFTAPDADFTFSSYWPNSNVKKADGQVVVE